MYTDDHQDDKRQINKRIFINMDRPTLNSSYLLAQNLKYIETITKHWTKLTLKHNKHIIHTRVCALYIHTCCMYIMHKYVVSTTEKQHEVWIH